MADIGEQRNMPYKHTKKQGNFGFSNYTRTIQAYKKTLGHRFWKNGLGVSLGHFVKQVVGGFEQGLKIGIWCDFWLEHGV